MQEAVPQPGKINPKKIISNALASNYQKSKTKKNGNAAKEKGLATHKGISIKLQVDFSTENSRPRMSKILLGVEGGAEMATKNTLHGKVILYESKVQATKVKIDKLNNNKLKSFSQGTK